LTPIELRDPCRRRRRHGGIRLKGFVGLLHKVGLGQLAVRVGQDRGQHARELLAAMRSAENQVQEVAADIFPAPRVRTFVRSRENPLLVSAHRRHHERRCFI